MPEVIECIKSEGKVTAMPSTDARRWVYPQPCNLPGQPLAGEGYLKGQCVQLVRKHLVGLRDTSTWRFEDTPILELSNFKPGTVVGNQKNGKWPAMPHGNHVGIFLRYGTWDSVKKKYSGFYIIEQFVSQEVEQIQVRFLPDKGKHPDGSFKDPSNNATAFFALKR